MDDKHKETGEAFKQEAQTSRMVCPKCGFDQLRRLERKGFWETNIYSFFGYYPWECIKCRTRSMFKVRHKRRSHAQGK